MKEKIKEIIVVNQSKDFSHLIKREITVSLFSNKILVS